MKSIFSNNVCICQHGKEKILLALTSKPGPNMGHYFSVLSKIFVHKLLLKHHFLKI